MSSVVMRVKPIRYQKLQSLLVCRRLIVRVAQNLCTVYSLSHLLSFQVVGFIQPTTQGDNMYNDLNLYHKILVDIFLTTAIIGFVALTIQTFFKDQVCVYRGSHTKQEPPTDQVGGSLLLLALKGGRATMIYQTEGISRSIIYNLIRVS